MAQTLLPLVNQLVATSVIAGQLFLVVVILSALFKGQYGNSLLQWLARNATLLSFIISAGAILTSLFYSNFIGFEPCMLCWWQRVFIYPIAFISGLALWKKDTSVGDYILTLAMPGFMVALYHNYLQYGGTPLIPCDASSEAAACIQRFVFEYNYVTIPLMSLTGFALIIMIEVLRRKYKKI